jgi:hypothetical protein
MSKSKRLTMLNLGLIFSMVSALGQTETSTSASRSVQGSPSISINDLINKEKAIRALESSKIIQSSPPPVPFSLPNPMSANSIESTNYFGGKDSSAHFNEFELVGIYYAKEVHKAEIIIGGIAQIYSQGDLLSSKWTLKTVEPTQIELQRCKERSKNCELKTINFTSSVRDH